MSDTRRTRPGMIRFGKWAGLFAGGLGWFADQQINAITAWTRCPVEVRTLVITVGVSCALLAIAGGWISFATLRRLPDKTQASDSSKTDYFIATLSVLMATFSVLAVIFGTPAGLILRCER